MATTYSADEPDSLRGPQHDTAWADELASWQYADAWDQLKFGLRLGSNPRICATTTPRPTEIIAGRGEDGKRLGLIRDPKTAVTRGTTYDNLANLAPEFVAEIRRTYESTRLGRQEIHAEILEDVEGSLWQRSFIRYVKEVPDFERVVVAVDPAVSATESSDETGIVVVGMAQDGQCYVLADCSGTMSPLTWAKRVVQLYEHYQADRIVAEVNNGGDLVEANIRTVSRNVPFLAVHATRGKRTRAEPIAALYERGRVHHVGQHTKLEDQLCEWVPMSGDKSPDRLDALVWAITDLAFAKQQPKTRIDTGDLVL
jgi:phage terminase large subunit-like protein